MATVFQDYVLFQTTEMTSHDKYIKTTHQTMEKSNTSSFLEEIDPILDLLIITFSIAILVAVVVLLFVIYRYLRNKRKSSNNVEMVRHQYKIDDVIEITPQQHNLHRGDVPAIHQQGSGKTFTQQKHSVNEGAVVMSPPYAKNDNRPQEQYHKLEGDNVVASNENVYEKKQQPMYAKKVDEESKEQDRIVHYENARSWKSSRDQSKIADNYHNANSDLIHGNEATYQNVSSMR